MAGQVPFRELFWANTQKHGVNNYEQRFRLMGAVIGEDEELMILRLPVDALGTEYQTEHTAASQTGLHIRIEDTREVLPLKLTKPADNTAYYIQLASIAADGTVTALDSGAADSGAWVDSSSAELKEKMKDLTETQITQLLEDLKIYRFNYINSPETVYVAPTAEDFHGLTGWGFPRAVSPLTIGSVALRLAQYLWKFAKTLDKRLKAIEDRLALTEDASGNPEV